jgi:TolA-binding protein
MKRLLSILAVVLVLAPPASAQDSKENADFKLAVNLYNDKLYDLAAEQFRQFVSLYPNTQQGIEARFYLGLAQTKLGRYEDARISFQNFALTYPEHPRAAEAWMSAAESFVYLKNDREAALAFERVKTFQPKSKFATAALLRSAELYERVGEPEQARRVLRMLTQEYSSAEVLPARVRLAELLLADGQDEQARIESRRVLDGTKDADLRSRAQLVMARALVKLGRTTEAETALSELTRDSKKTAGYHTALFLLGELRSNAANADDAIAAWRAIADDSTRAPQQVRQDALLELGAALERNGDDRRAREQYSRAAAIRGVRTGEAFYRAGVAAERAGDRSGAAALYSRAVADSLGRADRRAVLIGAFKAARWTNNSLEAVALAERYMNEYPDDARVPRLLVEAGTVLLENANDARRAEEFAGSVLRRFPASRQADEALFLQATAERRLGNLPSALSLFESLPDRFPASERLAAARTAAFEIRTYAMADRDAGLQKLALLIGDVIAQRSHGTLAYRLAEIYFHDLKDYRLAAEQYTEALQADLDESLRASAMFSRARAMEFSLKNPFDTRSKPSPLQVAAFYDSVTAYAGANEFASQARQASLLLWLEAKAGDDAFVPIADSVIGGKASVSDPGLVLLEIGRLSVQRKDTGRARAAFLRARTVAAGEEQRGGAMFGLAAVLRSNGAADSAQLILAELVKSVPNHRRAAEAIAQLAANARDRGDADRALAWYDQLDKRFFYTGFCDSAMRGRGEACFQAKRYADASSYAKRALDAMMNDPFAVARAEDVAELDFLLAVCAEKTGDRAAAKRWYAEYLLRDRTSERAGRAYYALASIARAENDATLAERYLREAGRLGGKASGLGNMALETADLLFQNEKYGDAVSAYTDVLKGSPSDSVRRVSQARIVLAYYRSDNAAEADRRAATFVKAYPNAYNEAAEFEFERGRYSLRKNDLDRARSRLRSVSSQYPKAPIVPEARYWLARSYELDQNVQAAVAIYDSLLRGVPNDPIIPRVHLALGNSYYALEQWDKAAAQYRTILDHEERAPDLVTYAMNNLIMTYKQMEMFDGAMELTRKYIERYPNDPDLMDKRIDIGVLYQKLGYHDQSIVHLQSLLESATPELEAELRYYIGEAYYYKGDHQQAILEFLKVPYLVTKRGKVDWISTAYYMAGQSYEKMSKYEQAVTMYKQIIDRKDTDAQFKTAAQKEIDRVRSLIGKK